MLAKFSKCCHFLAIFVQLKLTSLITLFDRKLTIFTHFYHLLSTQNVSLEFLSYQKWPIWQHCLTPNYRFSKSSVNWTGKLAFLVNFYPLIILALKSVLVSRWNEENKRTTIYLLMHILHPRVLKKLAWLLMSGSDFSRCYFKATNQLSFPNDTTCPNLPLGMSIS